MIRYLSRAKPNDLRGVALLRLDFNTEDDWRVKAALPTMRFLFRHARSVVIMGHKGRPSKKDEARFSLRSDAKQLEKLLKRRVTFLPRFNFVKIQKDIWRAEPKSVFLLENTRFLSGEEENKEECAKNLASLGDYYVNDAFAVSHRKNASVVAITKFLPSYAGFGLEKEIESLSHVMKRAARPLVVILGGSKASDKLGILSYFKKRADYFLLGGVSANTLLHLRGIDIKNSRYEKNPRDLKQIKHVLSYRNLILPIDWKTEGGKILDIGERSACAYADIIKKARTIIWNGPMGMFEREKFQMGSLIVAGAIADNKKAFSVAGGGETVTFLLEKGLFKEISFVSTGGGAMFDFLASKKLPGIEALKRKR